MPLLYRQVAAYLKHPHYRYDRGSISEVCDLIKTSDRAGRMNPAIGNPNKGVYYNIIDPLAKGVAPADHTEISRCHTYYNSMFIL